MANYDREISDGSDHHRFSDARSHRDRVLGRRARSAGSDRSATPARPAGVGGHRSAYLADARSLPGADSPARLTASRLVGRAGCAARSGADLRRATRCAHPVRGWSPRAQPWTSRESLAALDRQAVSLGSRDAWHRRDRRAAHRDAPRWRRGTSRDPGSGRSHDRSGPRDRRVPRASESRTLGDDS